MQGVNAAGGTVTTPDLLASVTLPPGAVLSLTDITIAGIAKSALPADTSALKSDGYNFGPDTSVFLQGITLTLKAQSAPDAGQRMLLAYLDNSNTWVPIGSSTFDSNTMTVSAVVNHFSIYAAISVQSDGTGCARWIDADAFCSPQVCPESSNQCGAPLPVTYHAVTGSIAGMVVGSYVTVHDNSQGDFNVTYPDSQFGLRKAFVSGDTYSVSIAGSPGLRCVMLAAGGVIHDANVVLSATCTLSVTFANNQNASMVLGQPDFATGTINLPAQNLLRFPAGPVYQHPSGILYVPDSDDARILGYRALPDTSAAAADFVLGQNDFVSRDGWQQSTPPPGGIAPVAMHGDADHLVAADAYTQRIAVYLPVPDTNNPPLLAAVGQNDITTGGNSNCTASTFATPSGVLIFRGKLIVADRYNHRVLIWNHVPTTCGTPADLVLGQPDFTTCSYPGAVSPNTLAQPMGLWTDGNRLLVVDRDSSRVLAWNTFPTANQQPADGFLGQVDFYSNDAGTDPNFGTNFPSSATSDGNHVYVTEPFRNRVTVWSGWPDAQNPPILAVLGQSDNSGYACNQNNNSPAANTLCDPEGVALIGTRLWVTDTGNSRVVVFDSM